MRSKALSYMQLVRLPNIFTAIADVLAGYFIVRGADIRIVELGGLVISTGSIYGAGCVLNDIADREVDARERPERPLPSGRISLQEAKILALVLFFCGLLGASLAGLASLGIAAGLIVLVLTYDLMTKNVPYLGSLNMGLCRGVNLLLGMSPILVVGPLLYFPVLSLMYVSFVTMVSNFENRGGGKKPSIMAFSGVVVLLLGFVALIMGDYLLLDSAVYVMLFALVTLPALGRAMVLETPGAIKKAVKYMILALPILDAVYVAGVRDFTHGIPVILCLVPAWLVAQYLQVT